MLSIYGFNFCKKFSKNYNSEKFVVKIVATFG